MFKYLSANSTRKYIDILDEFVEEYNSTKHSSIGMTPKEANKKKYELEFWESLYGNYIPPKRKARKISHHRLMPPSTGAGYNNNMHTKHELKLL